MAFHPEPAYQHGTIPKTAVLLVNLGTPDAPTPQALRPYLREFLSDPRVVEIPRPVWWLILNGIILNLRPKESAKKYASIWTSEGSPLLVHTQRQTKLLQGFLGDRIKSPLVVDYAMRYGNPSIPSVMTKLREQGCDRILVVPMYPQYAASATATVCDVVFAELQQMRNAPAVRTIKHFHDHLGYIAALAQNIRDHWMQNGHPDCLLMSFHGVPRFSLDKGDPYHCECQKTGRLLAEALGLAPTQYRITFQSRFGRAEWLQPYTAATLEELGKQGVKRVDAVCPGFIADCLETLEEIAMEGKETFLHSGGKEYHFIPCLNEREDWIKALTDIVLDNLHGWVSVSYDTAAANQAATLSRTRAQALGARN
ncbi:MAG: ferrochelatase [Pseudomonadota bacterium]